MSWQETRIFLSMIRELLTVVPLTVTMHDHGLELAERYGLRTHDAMIVAAALGAQCGTLWSEDMHDGLVVEKKLRIINPFPGR